MELKTFFDSRSYQTWEISGDSARLCLVVVPIEDTLEKVLEPPSIALFVRVDAKNYDASLICSVPVTVLLVDLEHSAEFKHAWVFSSHVIPKELAGDVALRAAAGVLSCRRPAN